MTIDVDSDRLASEQHQPGIACEALHLSCDSLRVGEIVVIEGRDERAAGRSCGDVARTSCVT